MVKLFMLWADDQPLPGSKILASWYEGNGRHFHTIEGYEGKVDGGHKFIGHEPSNEPDDLPTMWAYLPTDELYKGHGND
jgi:hypothetical protein